MNKRGSVFNWALVGITLFTLLAAAVFIMQKEDKFDAEIGKRQAELIKANINLEKEIYQYNLYADYSVNYASIESAREGGYSSYYPCQKFVNTVLWNTQLLDCFPTYGLLADNHNEHISFEMNQYVSTDDLYNDHSDNYNYVYINATQVIMYAINENIFPEQFRREYSTMPYEIRKNANFRKELPVPFTIYRNLTEESKIFQRKVAECENTGMIISECVKFELPNYWNYTKFLTEEDKNRYSYSDFFLQLFECSTNQDDCLCDLRLESFLTPVSILNTDNKVGIKPESSNFYGEHLPIQIGIVENHQELPIITEMENMKFVPDDLGGYIEGYNKPMQKLYKTNGNLSFIIPEEFSNNIDFYEKVPECKTSRSRYIFNYNTSIKVSRKNILRGENVYQDVIIKFALTMNDTLPPPPVENFASKNHQEAQRSLILNWNKNIASDVKYYELSYDNGVDNFVKRIEIDGLLMFDSQIAPTCDLKKVEESGVECVFGNKVLKPNQLYYVSDTEEFIFILTVPDDSEYELSISAVDFEGNAGVQTQANGASDDNIGLAQINELEFSLVEQELVVKFDSVTDTLIPGYPIEGIKEYHLFKNGISTVNPDTPLMFYESISANSDESSYEFRIPASILGTTPNTFLVFAYDDTYLMRSDYNTVKTTDDIMKYGNLVHTITIIGSDVNVESQYLSQYADSVSTSDLDYGS